MYARRKRSGGRDYLQIVESRRVDGRPKQKLVLYVGPYRSVADALSQMPGALTGARRYATTARKHAESYTIPRETSPEIVQEYQCRRDRAIKRAEVTRAEADALAKRLKRLRALVDEHPELVEA
jgi:hypothetical protein